MTPARRPWASRGAGPALSLALAGCLAPAAPPAPRVATDLPGVAAGLRGEGNLSHGVHTSASASVVLLRLEAEVPPHRHEHSDEVVYVLSGAGRLVMDGATRDVRAGDAVFVPRGARHGFVPSPGEPCVALSIHTPALRPGDRVPAP